jgi:hypothetical protein
MSVRYGAVFDLAMLADDIDAATELAEIFQDAANQHLAGTPMRNDAIIVKIDLLAVESR